MHTLPWFLSGLALLLTGCPRSTPPACQPVSAPADVAEASVRAALPDLTLKAVELQPCLNVGRAVVHVEVASPSPSPAGVTYLAPLEVIVDDAGAVADPGLATRAGEIAARLQRALEFESEPETAAWLESQLDDSSDERILSRAIAQTMHAPGVVPPRIEHTTEIGIGDVEELEGAHRDAAKDG